MRIFAFIAACVMLTFIQACNSPKETEEDKTISSSETASSETAVPQNNNNTGRAAPFSSYRYPREILKAGGFSGKTTEEFYPIGFSMDGKFAYISRPCDEGCGCCTHMLNVQDLMTDKIKEEVNLKKGEVVEDYIGEWDNKLNRVKDVLGKNNILQNNFSLIKSNTIFCNGNSYKVSFSVQNTTDDDEYLGYSALQYTVRLIENDRKSALVSNGKFSDGNSFDYLGYLQSPYSDHVVLVFNKNFKGWEATDTDKLLLVGCTLESKYFK